MIEFPKKRLRNQLMLYGAADFWLTGIDCNKQGKGECFNFYLSNNHKSEQRQGYILMQPQMMSDECKTIRRI